ncbi:CorA family divalent cation transporter [Methylobacterium marchantiae]|uniref:CorA family divalent cation transporter n=1 Tax=Methylobacterium marchantiae TaxID=600331 RepID=A0ABW3WTH0_9HYPH|nr:Zinc transport protein ZntB [Methylobacterium marchantiae]
MQHLLIEESSLPGLIFALRFGSDGRGRRIEPGDDLPSLDGAEDGFVWLHIDLVDARTEALITEGRLGPPRLAAATFARDEHQRVVVDGAHAGFVIADRERAFDGSSSEEPNGRLHCVLGPGYLVSGRRHATACAVTARDAVLAGALVPGPAKLLERFVGSTIESLNATVERLSSALDAIEDDMLDEARAEDPRPLGPIRRQSVRSHRQLAGLRAVFHRLEDEAGTEGDQLPEAVAAMAARVVQRLDSLHRDMHVLSERSRLLQDEIAARTTALTNRQLFTLSILTALFLPPTLVTGVFGMNTKGLFFSDSDSGSLIALAIGLAAALAVYLVIRRLGLSGRPG